MAKILENLETKTLTGATYERYLEVPLFKVWLLKSVCIRWFSGIGTTNPKLAAYIEYDIDGLGTWRRIANLGKVTLIGTIMEVVVSFPMNPSLKVAAGGCTYISAVDEVGLDRLNIPFPHGFRIVCTIEDAAATEQLQTAINVEEFNC